MKRILHIVGRMDRAGAETMIMNLYREIDLNKFQFDFLYFTNDKCDFDDEIEELGGRIVQITAGNPVARFLAIRKLLKNSDWRIVHSHTLFSSGLHLLAAKMARVPKLVAHSHNTSDVNTSTATGRAYQKCMRWLLSWVPTSYVACGKAAAAYLFPGKANVEVIPNAIDIAKFTNATGTAVRKSLDIEKNKLVILQVGRLLPVKNHTFSVQVAAALRDSGAEFLMLFVGTGPEHQKIETMLKQHGLEDHVSLLGLREDIPELMAAADVMLMPSLYEGFPVVLVESQAAGLPAVISSTISPEVDLRIGLVEFVSLDVVPKGWATKIKSARNSSSSVKDRQHALETHGFSARAGAVRLMSIYKSL